jgi:hypothetical protein
MLVVRPREAIKGRVSLMVPVWHLYRDDAATASTQIARIRRGLTQIPPCAFEHELSYRVRDVWLHDLGKPMCPEVVHQRIKGSGQPHGARLAPLPGRRRNSLDADFTELDAG